MEVVKVKQMLHMESHSPVCCCI